MRLKKEEFTQSKYNELLEYANLHNSTIQLIDGYYTTVEIIDDRTLEELKNEKIEQLKENCYNYILSVYPLYKQMNILNPLFDYTEQDRIKMNEFINKQREICNTKQANIEACESKEELEKIVIEFAM